MPVSMSALAVLPVVRDLRIFSAAAIALSTAEARTSARACASARAILSSASRSGARPIPSGSCASRRRAPRSRAWPARGSTLPLPRPGGSCADSRRAAIAPRRAAGAPRRVRGGSHRRGRRATFRPFPALCNRRAGPMNAKNAIITQKTGSDGSKSIETSLGGGLQHLLDLGGAHVLTEQLADDRARGLRRDLVDARQGLGLGGGDARFRVGELGREVPSTFERSLSVSAVSFSRMSLAMEEAFAARLGSARSRRRRAPRPSPS